MALKTFNLDDVAYKEFSKYCKKNGISMSKKIENFIRDELDKLKNKKNTPPNVEKSAVKIGKAAVSVERHSFSKYC